MIVTDYKPINRGYLMGFFNVEIPEWRLRIYSLSYFQKDGKRWVSFPSRKVSKEGEEDKYLDYMGFTDADTRERFIKACLKALDEYIMLNHG